jgi:hypothetical protein
VLIFCNVTRDGRVVDLRAQQRVEVRGNGNGGRLIRGGASPTSSTSINFPNGTASNGAKPQDDEISFNLVVAGGGANSAALDHDDGSSF